MTVKSKQSGVGLLEILIALALGLILTFGMIQVFLGSKEAYRTQDALARIQENGRYVMEILGRDIRMAGFQGCGSLDIVSANVVATGISGTATFVATDTLGGYEFNGSFAPTFSGSVSSTAPAPISGTDVITVTRADDCGAYLSAAMANESSAVVLTGDNTACNFQANDLALVSDCASLDLFRVTGVAVGGTPALTTLSHASSGNTSGRLSKPFGADARIYKFIQRDYFIANNAFGEPSLFRRENGAAAAEMVEGVSDLELQYGEDTGLDFFVDRYVDANVVADWSRVTSVRPVITFQSVGSIQTAANKAEAGRDPDNVANQQQRMQQQMTATIGIRNRLP